MTDLNSLLSHLRRPRLLVRAARHGLSDYNRNRDLQRLTGQSPRANSRSVIDNLVAQEEQVEEIRQTGDATYSIAHHIELLVALMAECRLLPTRLRT